MVRLEEGMSAFGVKFERWRNAAQKAGSWFIRVEKGAESFMRKWHDRESGRAVERHAKAAAAPPTFGIPTRREGGERGRRGGRRGGHTGGGRKGGGG